MSQAQLFVDGTNWDFMGEVTDSFSAYTNNLQASRSGQIYIESETKVKMLKIDEIKVRRNEAQAVQNFLNECSSKVMTITVFYDSDCPDDSGTEVTYLGCRLSGEQEHMAFGDKITGFEVGYEQRIEREV